MAPERRGGRSYYDSHSYRRANYFRRNRFQKEEDDAVIRRRIYEEERKKILEEKLKELEKKDFDFITAFFERARQRCQVLGMPIVYQAMDAIDKVLQEFIHVYSTDSLLCC